MRGKKARQLRKQAFGEQSRRTKHYLTNENGTVKHTPESPMGIYKKLKKENK